MMTFCKRLVFVLCLLCLISISKGESKKIIELPEGEQTVEASSSLPPNVQTNGTNSSSLPVPDSTLDSTSTPELRSADANSSSSIDAEAASAEALDQTTRSPSPISDSVPDSSAFGNETFDVNLTTTPSFDDVFSNDTLEFTNSSAPESATEPPPLEKESPEYEEDFSVRQSMFLDDYCSCDIKVESCDVNCCCDRDCAADDRRAFSGCLTAPRPLAGDSRYCVQKWVLQHHNTEYSIDTTNPNLFCIITDNLVQRTSFPPVKVIRTAEDFQKVSQVWRRDILSSSDDEASLGGRAPTPPNKPYQHGDLVWGVSYEGSLFPIGVPSAMFTSSCEAESLLKYLTDFKTECHRQVHLNFKQSKDKSLHPSSYTGFDVLIQPSLLFERWEEEDTTATPTESTSTSSTSSSTTIAEGPSIPSTSTGALVNNSIGATELLNVSSDVTPTVTPTTPGPASTADSTSTSANITDHVAVGIELTPSDSTPSENQVIRNMSTNSTNYRAKLESSENFILLEDEPSIFNDTVLCKVRVILCFTSPGTVCYNASDPKAVLSQCDVVTEVNYVIFHNGSEGIKSVTAKVSVKDICTKQLNPQQSRHSSDESFEVELNLKQKFSVEYRWIQDEQKLVRERSGRPGYLRGKPLLFGRSVRNVSEEGFSVHAIAMDSDPMRGLTVLRGAGKGDCAGRSPVAFGQNVLAQCIMRVSPSDITHNCTELRTRVRHQLLGEVLSDGESELRVGAYGDSDVHQASQWVPLLRTRDTTRAHSREDVLEEGRCSDLMTSMTLEIAFSLQGSLANPQAKVVGALLTEGPLRPSPPAFCVGPFCPERSHLGAGSAFAEDDRIEEEGSGHSSAINENIELIHREGSGEEAFVGTTKPPVQKLTRTRNGLIENREKRMSQAAYSIRTPSYESNTVAIELSTTVIFTDVTEPSEPAFPDPPRLDIKLPENFFYPLVPSSSGSRFRAFKFVHAFCLTVVLFLRL